MSEQAKVEQRHERIASKTLEAMAYATNGNEEFKALAQALANAEAAGYAAGVKDEREACAKVAESSGDEVGCPQEGSRRQCHVAIADAIRSRSDANAALSPPDGGSEVKP